MRVLPAIAALCAILSAFADSVPVRPNSLCEISFAAAVEKGPTVESAPELAELIPVSASVPTKTGLGFCALEWRFLDAEGKAIRHPRITWDTIPLFSSQEKTFRFRVYSPENAAKIELVPRLVGQDDRVRISGLAAKVVEPDGILNVNPHFADGDDYLPGWQLTGPARLMKDDTGRNYVLLEDGGVFGDLFPVRGLKKLAITLKGGPPHYATRRHIPWGAVYFFDGYEEACNAKPFAPFVRPKLELHSTTLTENTVEYDVPKSAAWCRIAIRVGDITACEVRSR